MPQATAVSAKQNAVPEVSRKGFKFSVKISPDRLLAHLVIEQERGDDEKRKFEFSREELKNILKKAGVIHGINEDKLEEIAQGKFAVNKPIEVAKGTPPGKSKDAGFELLFDISSENAPIIGDDGLIDYKNLNLVKNATKGQPLAKKIPAEPGKPGMTVTGEKVEGKPGKDRALPQGKNTEISPDNPDLLIASKDGSPLFSNNLVSVSETYKINSTVDVATGNIDFVGSLVIAGGVSAGFKVKAEGNIEIGGNVEDAEIVSGGSVMIKGGFVGSGKGIIKAAQDVFVKYVENQTIVAGHDVHIGGSAVGATIVSNNSVVVEGSRPTIVGGSVTSSNLVKSGSFGSEFGTPTLIRVGYNRKLIDKLNKIDEDINQLKENEKKIKEAMYTLVRLELDNRLNDNQKKALAELKKHQAEIPDQLAELTERKEELERMLNENKKARVVATDTVFPGTIIQIGLKKKEFVKVIKNCTFKISYDQVTFVSN